MIQTKIEITSNSDTLQLKNEFLKCVNTIDLVLSLEIQVEKEEEILTCAANQLQSLINLKGLTLIFTKYSLFAHFDILTSTLSLLRNLTDLQIHIEKYCYFQDTHLKDLTESITSLSNLTKLSLLVKKGSQIQYTSSSYLFNCIDAFPLLESLTLQIEDSSYFQRNETFTGLSNTIKNCKRLKELIVFIDTKFSDNTLISGIGEAIASLSSLETLEVKLSEISNKQFIIELLMNSISNLKFLKKLRLENLEEEGPKLDNKQINSIKNCMANLFHLESLEIKNLIDHHVHSIVNESSILHSLCEWQQKLRISDQPAENSEYTYLPQCFNKFSNLKKLELQIESDDIYCRKNFYECLTEGFSHMLQLKCLKIEHNYSFEGDLFDFKVFFEEIKKLTNLESLELVFEYLEIDQYLVNQLEKSLKQLKHLKNLKLNIGILRHTNSIELMKAICNQSCLEELFLQFGENHNLDNFLTEFKNLSQLKNLAIKQISDQGRGKEELEEENEDEDEYEKEEKEGNNDETSDNLYAIFQNLSKLSALQNLDLDFQMHMSKKSSLGLRNALFEMKNLQRAKLYLELVSLTDLTEIMKGFQSQNFEYLKLTIDNLEGTLSEDIPSFKEFKSLKFFNLEIQQFENQKETFKFIKTIFDQLSNLQTLKLSIREIPYDFITILNDFISHSPQLLTLKIVDKSFPSRNQPEQQIKENEVILFDQQILKNHKLRKVHLFGLDKYNTQSTEYFLQFNNMRKVLIHDRSCIAIKFTNGRKKLVVKEKNKQQIEDNRNTENEQNKIFSKSLMDLKILSSVSLKKQLAHLPSLQKLEFENKQVLTSEDLSELGAALQKLQRVQYLRLHLNFPETAVDKESLLSLSIGILNSKNLKYLKFAIFSDCEIDSGGLVCFMSALQYLKKLQTLFISIDKQNGNDNLWLLELGRSLIQLFYLENLSLDVGDENGEEQKIGEGVKSIGDSFKFLNYLTELKLTFGKSEIIIEEQGAIALGRGISNLSNLQIIELSFEESVKIQQNGGLEIMQGVTRLTNLNSIIIQLNEVNNKKSETMTHLTRNLCKMNSLTYLESYIQGDNFDGLQFDLETFLKSKQSLKTLYFQIIIEENKIRCEFSSEYPYSIVLSFEFRINYDSIPNDLILQNSKALNQYPLNFCFKFDILSSNIYIRNLRQLVQQLPIVQSNTLKLTVEGEYTLPLDEIFKEIYQMRNLKNLSIRLSYGAPTYEEIQKYLQQLSLTKSEDLQELNIRWDYGDELIENQKAILDIMSEISKFKKLRILILYFYIIRSDSCKLAVYKKLMKQSLSIIHILINNNPLSSLRQGDEDEYEDGYPELYNDNMTEEGEEDEESENNSQSEKQDENENSFDEEEDNGNDEKSEQDEQKGDNSEVE